MTPLLEFVKFWLTPPLNFLTRLEFKDLRSGESLQFPSVSHELCASTTTKQRGHNASSVNTINEQLNSKYIEAC
jgi:hypothetical protein